MLETFCYLDVVIGRPKLPLIGFDAVDVLYTELTYTDTT